MNFSLRTLQQSTFIKNVASLGVLQISNYIIPVLVIPFVTRALGRECFGMVSYVQNIVAYLTLLVTFGYEYSATQDIALLRDDPTKRAVVFWTVIKSRMKLFGISVLLLGILYFSFGVVQQQLPLFIAGALINLGVALYPTWFFQGIEEMGKMAVFGFFIKFVGGLLVVALVRTPDDGLLYLSLMSGSYVLVAMVSLVYVVRHYDIPLSVPAIPDLSKSVKRHSFPIFLNTLFVSLYTIMGVTILGFYTDNGQVGLYSGASRIIMAVMMIVNAPISIGLFPIISRAWNRSYAEGWAMFKKSLGIVALIGFIVTIVVLISSPLLVKILLGAEFIDSIPILRIFSVLPFLVVIASLLTIQGLYGMQRQKLAPIVGFITAVCGLIAYIIAIPASGTQGAALAWVASQMVEIIVSGTILLLVKPQKSL